MKAFLRVLGIAAALAMAGGTAWAGPVTNVATLSLDSTTSLFAPSTAPDLLTRSLFMGSLTGTGINAYVAPAFSPGPSTAMGDSLTDLTYSRGSLSSGDAPVPGLETPSVAVPGQISFDANGSLVVADSLGTGVDAFPDELDSNGEFLQLLRAFQNGPTRAQRVLTLPPRRR